MPTRQPNHIWCSECSLQTPELNTTTCERPLCNAKYCQSCVKILHADYFRLPRPNGSEPSNSMRPRCKFCNAVHRLEFFKASKCVPVSITNLGDLRRERIGVQINYFQNRISYLSATTPTTTPTTTQTTTSYSPPALYPPSLAQLLPPLPRNPPPLRRS